MKKSELKEIIRTAFLAEINAEDEDMFGSEKDMLSFRGDHETDGNPLDTEMPSWMMEQEDEEEEETEDIEDMDSEERSIDMPDDNEGLEGNEAEIQDALNKAIEAAKKLGDEKLVNQIGNTITFFTRAHIVGDQINSEMPNEQGLEENISPKEWEDMSEEEREEILLSAVKDPDDASKYSSFKYDDLPDEITQNMVSMKEDFIFENYLRNNPLL